MQVWIGAFLIGVAPYRNSPRAPFDFHEKAAYSFDIMSQGECVSRANPRCPITNAPVPEALMVHVLGRGISQPSVYAASKCTSYCLAAHGVASRLYESHILTRSVLAPSGLILHHQLS